MTSIRTNLFWPPPKSKASWGTDHSAKKNIGQKTTENKRNGQKQTETDTNGQKRTETSEAIKVPASLVMRLLSVLIFFIFNYNSLALPNTKGTDGQTKDKKTDITTFKLNRPLVWLSENTIEKNQMDSIVLFSGEDRGRKISDSCVRWGYRLHTAQGTFQRAPFSVQCEVWICSVYGGLLYEQHYFCCEQFVVCITNVKG